MYQLDNAHLCGSFRSNFQSTWYHPKLVELCWKVYFFKTYWKLPLLKWFSSYMCYFVLHWHASNQNKVLHSRIVEYSFRANIFGRPEIMLDRCIIDKDYCISTAFYLLISLSIHCTFYLFYIPALHCTFTVHKLLCCFLNLYFSLFFDIMYGLLIFPM